MSKQEMPKLKDGDEAPYFSVVDINGEKVEIDRDNGTKIFLSFFRYSGCPWCNLAIYRLTQMAPDLEAQGIKVHYGTDYADDMTYIEIKDALASYMPM